MSEADDIIEGLTAFAASYKRCFGQGREYETLVAAPTLIARQRDEIEDERKWAARAHEELSSIGGVLGVRFMDPPDGGDVSLAEQVQRMSDALAARDAEVERLRAVLRNIAEGNLGDAPWQANYERIRSVARAALSVSPAPGEGDGWRDIKTIPDEPTLAWVCGGSYFTEPEMRRVDKKWRETMIGNSGCPTHFIPVRIPSPPPTEEPRNG